MKKRDQIEQQDRLLSQIREICSQGVSESEPEGEDLFLKRFIPIQSHFRILDPDVRIIIGDKGAGKTHLFRALEMERGRKSLIESAQKKGLQTLPLDKMLWLTGFKTEGADFPPAGVIRSFARENDSFALQNIWLGLLVKVLLRSEIFPEFRSFPSLRTIESGKWNLPSLNEYVEATQSELFMALDRLEKDLQEYDKFIFVSYDELDRTSPGDWDALKTILHGLTQFWAAYGRRWKRIRPKLFLRRDLYQRAALSGPDISKIASNRAELTWRIHEFYGVIFKRLFNEDDFFKFLKPPKELIGEDKILGKTVLASQEEDYNSVVNRLFGEYMGTDPRKGRTLRWIPNHLKDGYGRIYPRPLLRLVEEAAEIEIRDRKARGTGCLIHHSALRGALDKVSEFRIEELYREEFPWLREIIRNFEGRNLLVPGNPRNFIAALKINWDEEEDRPPETNPRSLLQYLVELGIFSSRRDGRIDVGDLYLRGLHLKRKGGVARPRTVRTGEKE